MQSVRILADDLTGALDTAACFCGDTGPLAVVWDMQSVSPDKSLAYSSESRDLSEDEARKRAQAGAAILRADAAISFKKIDSLLRGHVAAELAAVLSGNEFDSVVLAPAFPGLGRVTRQGRQWVRYAAGETPQLLGTDLARDLARYGLAVQCGPAASPAITAPAIWLPDAQSDDDLRRIAEAAQSSGGRILWCGTAGLAAALAEHTAEIAPCPANRLLIVCGTNHPVALTQMQSVREVDDSGIITCTPGGEQTAADAINCRLRAGSWAAFMPQLPMQSPAQASRDIHAMLARLLPRLDKPDALFAMGGETLHACCDVLAAKALVVHGLYEAGLPVSALSGGAWDSVATYSKSGAFGGAHTLVGLIRNISLHSSQASRISGGIRH